MKKGDKKLILLLALLVIVGGAVLLIPTKSTEPAATEESAPAATEEEKNMAEEIAKTNIIKVDDDMPVFSVEMSSGETITPEMLRGKVVLVNFWATWCPPCRQELQRVQKDIVERYEGRDFVFLPISRGEKSETVLNFLKENGYTFPVGIDTDQTVFSLFAKEYIPRNYLVNRMGVVVEATIGYDPEEFDSLLQKIDMTLNAR